MDAPFIEAVAPRHDPETSAERHCVEVCGEEQRLGGRVRFSAHICLSQEPHAVEGVVRDVTVSLDTWCSAPVVREALTDSATADALREDLARVAVRTYLLGGSAVSWRPRPLD
jgi:hypothetical protein